MNQTMPVEPTNDGPEAWLVIEADNLPAGAEAFWRRSEALFHATVLASQGCDVHLRHVRIRGDRTRCRLCGEPVELADPLDELSWIHAPDANDLGDHTAEV